MKKLSSRNRDKIMRLIIDACYTAPSRMIDIWRFEKLQQLCKNIGCNDVQYVLDVLVGMEYLKFIAHSGASPNASHRAVYVTLTNKGKCYFEQQSDERRNFYKNSVIVPIIVAIITTIITVYILPPLAEQAIKWLSLTP